MLREGNPFVPGNNPIKHLSDLEKQNVPNSPQAPWNSSVGLLQTFLSYSSLSHLWVRISWVTWIPVVRHGRSTPSHIRLQPIKSGVMDKNKASGKTHYSYHHIPISTTKEQTSFWGQLEEGHLALMAAPSGSLFQASCFSEDSSHSLAVPAQSWSHQAWRWWGSESLERRSLKINYKGQLGRFLYFQVCFMGGGISRFE